MVQNYTASPGQDQSNPSLWSLPVEVELYAIYPLLYFIWKRLGTTVVVGVIASTLAVAALVSSQGAAWPLGGSLGYLAIWCSGAFLAEITARGQYAIPLGQELC